MATSRICSPAQPRHDRGEDPHVHRAPVTGLGVEQEPQLGEVDLALHPRLPVDDPHGRGLDTEPAALDREHGDRQLETGAMAMA